MNDINLTLGTIIQINKFTLTQEAAKIGLARDSSANDRLQHARARY